MNPEDNSSNALPEVQPDFPLAQLNSAATKPPDDPIYILPSNHWSITRAAKRLFRALAPLQVMFVHFGVVVELILEPVKKQYQLNPIKPDQAASRFERVGQLWKHVVVKDKVVLKQSICSEAIAKLLLGTREALELLYPITMVVNSPVLVEGPDGKCAMLAAGYHHLNRGTLVTKGERPPTVPLPEAVDALPELLEDFDFEMPSDQLRALATFLTPALVWGGFLGDDHVPMFVAEANEPQAGKGYILERAAAIYGEPLVPLSQRRGGVGSFDESFDSMLLKGRPIICFDNLRDKLDSMHVESFLTARDAFPVRTPHRDSIEVDVRKYILFATSNEFQTTLDLEYRLLRMRIRKRPATYNFKRFSGATALNHIKKRQSYYLGCVFSIVAYWVEQGKPRTSEIRHSFRGWPALLEKRLCGLEVRGSYFRALAWQDLINHLPLDPNVRSWAREKHKLE